MPGPYDAQYAGIRQKIAYYAQKWGIDADLAIWQIWQESKFKPGAESRAGARGIAQFMPKRAERFGVNVWDIDASLNGYGQYMAYLKRFFGGDMTKAVAAYKAGVGAVSRFGNTIPPYPETRGYVQEVLQSYATEFLIRSKQAEIRTEMESLIHSILIPTTMEFLM